MMEYRNSNHNLMSHHLLKLKKACTATLFVFFAFNSNVPHANLEQIATKTQEITYDGKILPVCLLATPKKGKLDISKWQRGYNYSYNILKSKEHIAEFLMVNNSDNDSLIEVSYDLNEEDTKLLRSLEFSTHIRIGNQKISENDELTVEWSRWEKFNKKKRATLGLTSISIDPPAQVQIKHLINNETNIDKTLAITVNCTTNAK